jgi:hypothetical protein
MAEKSSKIVALGAPVFCRLCLQMDGAIPFACLEPSLKDRPLDFKHRIAQILGVAAVVGGTLRGLLYLRGFTNVRDVWGVTGQIVGLAFAVYLVSVGIRSMRWAKGETRTKTPRIIWGRALIGTTLTFTNIENRFHPAPHLLKPSNEGEAAGMVFAEVASTVLGAWLIVSAIRARFKKPIVGEETSKTVSGKSRVGL